MAGGVELDVDLIIGTEQLAKLNDQIQDSLNRGLTGAAGNAVGGLGKVNKGLDNIRTSSRRAGDATEEMLEKLSDQLAGIAASSEEAAAAATSIFSRVSVEDQIGAFGDLKDVFEQTAGSLLGMSEAAIEASINVADIIEKGANIGKVLGPEGAVAGAAIGLVVGGLSEWAAAADKAKQAQIDLSVNAILQTNERLRQQQATLATNIKIWDDYVLAVRRANGTQLGLIEGLVSADKAQFEEEQKGREERLTSYEDNLTKIKAAMVANRVESLSLNEVYDLQEAKRQGASFSSRIEEQLKYSEDYLKNEAGRQRVESEIKDAAAERTRNLAFSVQTEATKAFDQSAKATKEFNAQLDRIKSPPTLKDLKEDEQKATKAAEDAQEALDNLNDQLLAPRPENEGFEAYAKRITGVLVDASVAAGLLSKAQADVLAAASAVKSADPKPPTSTKSPEADDRFNKDANGNALVSSAEAEKARQEKINDDIRASRAQDTENARAHANELADIEDAKTVDAFNKQEEFIQRQLEVSRTGRQNEIAAAQELADEKQKIRDDELKATVAFQNALIDGAMDTAKLISGALAGEAVNSFNRYLDAVANGEKITKEQRQRNRAEFLRDLGTKLINDGVGHIAMGTAKAFGGDPAGVGEAIAGAGEVALGGTMGGVGARAQRGLGGTSGNASARGVDGGPSVSNIDNAANGTNNLPTMVVNITNAVPQTERGAQQQAKILQDTLSKGRK